MLVVALATFIAGCSGSGSGKEQKKGTPIAQINQNQEGITFVDANGNRIIDTKDFSQCGTFSEGLCAVTDKATHQLGFIDVKGHLVIPCQFPDPSFLDGTRGIKVRCRAMFHCGYARVGSSEGNVLIDRKGNTLLEGYSALDWDGDVAIVCKDDIRQPGLVTMSGTEVVPMGTYRKMEFIGEGMLKVVGNDWGTGIIDTKGNVLVDNVQELKKSEAPYGKVGTFVDGYVVVQVDNGDWRVMDKKGSVVKILPKYVGNTLTFGGQMPVFDNGCVIFDNAIYNSSLEKVADYPPQGTRANSYAFVDGMASVYEGTMSEPLIGFVNTKGDLVIPCRYSEKRDFNDGLAFVKDDEGWHIIDKKGNITGTLQQENIQPYQLGKFCAGRAIIGDKVVVDKTGTVIDIPDMTQISDFYYSGNDNSFLNDEF